MSKSRSHTRGHAKHNPCGKLAVMRGGFGFVDTPEGEYFIPAAKMNGAFDADTVEIAPINVDADRRHSSKPRKTPGRKPSARIIRVVRRAHETLVGRYEIAEPFGIVIPLDERIRYDIFTSRHASPDVEEGDIVKVRIDGFPSRRETARGTVEKVIGHAGAKGIEIESIIAEKNLETEFSDDELNQARGTRVDVQGALDAGYDDLRDRFIFTIDPADARDYDDALSLDEVEGGWRLGVHIADVSYYVPQDSLLDCAARRRATSVYLVDRVIPMLPENLSNDVCSLAPDQVRRAITVDMVLTDEGEVQSCAFHPSLIRSCRRLSYDQAQQILDEGTDDTELGLRLKRLSALAKNLERQRVCKGALDFTTTEAHVILDGDGIPVKVNLRTRSDATSLVEQSMIAANTCVARYLAHRGHPCIFRVHDAPSPDALAHLVPILQEFGYAREVDLDAFVAGDPFVLQKVLAKSAGRPESELLSMLLLRSLKRAEYRTQCDPHYGLAISCYAHFTSPIRRYPDLIVHRMLKECLAGPGGGEEHDDGLSGIAEHSSAMERVADAAALESQTVKLIEYLEGFLGETFSGVVSKVASFGFFVRLDNTAVGLVPLGTVGHEPFALDTERQMLTGRESGKVFRLGQRVLVRIVGADAPSRHLDFALVSGKAQRNG